MRGTLGPARGPIAGSEASLTTDTVNQPVNTTEDRGTMVGDMSVTESRRLLPGPERRASIFDAAARAFAQEGYAATSMAEVAQRAGVSKVLLYRHVDSKAALYRGVLEDALEDMGREFDARFGSENGAIWAVVTVARRRPDAVRLLVRHASREPEFAAYVTELRSQVVANITPLLAPRSSDPTHLRWAVELAVTLVWEGVLEWLDHGTDDDESFVARLGAGVQAALGAWL